ncbi:MAG: hypothetical protein DMF90_09720, partial [Acidobacteria bacterium]
MAKSTDTSLNRRRFLKKAAAGAAGATASVSGISLRAQTSPAPTATTGQPPAGGRAGVGTPIPPPTDRQLARETGGAAPPSV